MKTRSRSVGPLGGPLEPLSQSNPVPEFHLCNRELKPPGTQMLPVKEVALNENGTVILQK